MTEREKIIDITKVLFKNDLEYGDYFEIDKEALDLLADALIENGIGDIAEWKEKYARLEREVCEIGKRSMRDWKNPTLARKIARLSNTRKSIICVINSNKHKKRLYQYRWLKHKGEQILRGEI